jgi:hypothetical protein
MSRPIVDLGWRRTARPRRTAGARIPPRAENPQRAAVAGITLRRALCTEVSGGGEQAYSLTNRRVEIPAPPVDRLREARRSARVLPRSYPPSMVGHV